MRRNELLLIPGTLKRIAVIRWHDIWANMMQIDKAALIVSAVAPADATLMRRDDTIQCNMQHNMIQHDAMRLEKIRDDCSTQV